MADTRNDRPVLRMTFDAAETEILLVWAQLASRESWQDAEAGHAARNLCHRLRYAVSAQCPQVGIDGDFGDFT